MDNCDSRTLERIAGALEGIEKELHTIASNTESANTNLEMMKKILFSYVVFQGMDVLQLLEKDLPEIHAVIFEYLHRSSHSHR
nr:hypothetical protein [Peptostreptococcus faecalis]